MEIMLNGKTQDVKTESSLLSLLEDLGILSKAMAIAVNMQIVKKDRWAEHKLKEGDEVEILDFVGGG